MTLDRTLPTCLLAILLAGTVSLSDIVSAAPPRRLEPAVPSSLAQLTQDVYSRDPAATERLRAIVSQPGPTLVREQALRLLASVPHPGLVRELTTIVTAKEALVLRAAAAVALYQWDRGERTLAAVLALQEEGAPMRSAFRTGYTNGAFLYDSRALAAFRLGVLASQAAARVDAAAGLAELGQDAALAESTLIDVLTREPRWDDRVLVLTTIAYLPHQPWFERVWMHAMKDRDPRVRDAAKRHFR